MLTIAAFLAYLAAVLFFALATFTVSLGDTPEIAAGLLCVAIGFVLERLAGVVKPYAERMPL